ncbi:MULTISPECIES: serine hydrolase [Aerosakkonema]|uniref:serine hydrolase n=1 Tax=Aerosakkonema TaxID=1246629 RepID=UPI0035B8781C
MRQREPYQSKSSYQRISELEEKLNRANRFIKRLQQNNAELQKQLFSLQKRDKHQSALSLKDIPVLPERQPSRIEDIPLLPEKQPSRRRRRRRAKHSAREQTHPTRRLTPKRRLARVYQLRLAGIALGVAAMFFLVGLIVVRLVYRPPAPEPSPQPTPTNVLLLPESPLAPPEIPASTGTVALASFSEQTPENIEIVYNPNLPPDLKQSQDLQAIVDELVNMADEKNLPTDSLSITLINVKTGEIAGYQQQELRYPASVIKMFWMVYVYALLEQGIFTDEAAFNVDLYQMIQNSSNDAASRIMDAVTGAKSGARLKGEEYQDWLNKRQQLNNFFQKAGYEGIILNQKTYPIGYLKLQKPEGREMQMWKDPEDPMQNKISSDQAARLMYEIVTGKSVSEAASRKMVRLLARDLHPEAWDVDSASIGGFNPVRGFLGESLPPDSVDFASKAGWTSTSRHEVAFVKTRDGQVAYILAILGSSRTYSSNWKLFPQMSRFVFDRLTVSNQNPSPN